jgi:hypothetical protein
VPAMCCWPSNTTLRAGPAARFARVTDLATALYRSPDPLLTVQERFIFRRIAADSRKVEFGPDAKLELHYKVIRAMGFELGAIHGSANAARTVRETLDDLRSGWLYEASRRVSAWVKAEFHEWKRHRDRDKPHRSHASSDL